MKYTQLGLGMDHVLLVHKANAYETSCWPLFGDSPFSSRYVRVNEPFRDSATGNMP